MRNVMTLIAMFFCAGSIFGNSDIDIILSKSIKDTNRLQRFEAEFLYPYSDSEEFRIKHGKQGNYFAFFESLGKPYYYLAIARKSKQVVKIIDGEQITVDQQAGDIAAAACCVLRKVPSSNGKMIRAWYICDVKVGRKYQGEHIPLLMIKKAGFWRYLQCPRGFAICMNPAVGEPRAASIFKKHSTYTGVDTQTLNLYTMSSDQVEQMAPMLKEILVRHGYMESCQFLISVSTSGMKDYEIIDTNTGESRPWLLRHLCPSYTKQSTPLSKDATYMICSVEGTSLDDEFRAILGAPSSTAQIVSYNMKDVDFNWLTSNQI